MMFPHAIRFLLCASLLFLFSSTASAGIVFTDFDPDIVLNDHQSTSGPKTDRVDIDSDGTDDLLFANEQTSFLGSISRRSYIETLPSNVWITSAPVAECSIVNSSLMFTQGDVTVPISPVESYFGFRIDNAAGSNFGYVRVENSTTFTSGDRVLIIDLFAVTNANESSIKVSPTAVPEPSVVAMFLLTCCSVVRRRRS